MIARDVAMAAMRDAITAVDPAARVAAALASPAIAPRIAGRELVGIAMGKSSLAMVRGAGPVARGIVVAPETGEVPSGWKLMIGAHPEPDERSLAAGEAIADFVKSAKRAEVMLALISGGASSLVEKPLPPVELDELRAVVRAVAAAGAPIREVNAVRSALSSLKAGRLARTSASSIITLAQSDVIGDELAVIGSGPTVGSWLGASGQVDLTVELAARRARARAIANRYGVEVPPHVDEVLDAEVDVAPQIVARNDYAEIVARAPAFAEATCAALVQRGVAASFRDVPLADEVSAAAQSLLQTTGVVVAWGEPTIKLPAKPGAGGRAQHLALLLARSLKGTPRSAFVVGSDGIDGPAPSGRPAPAGAFVDGTTWDRVTDADGALARFDAGTALASIDALVITGPTGINHADLVVIG